MNPNLPSRLTWLRSLTILGREEADDPYERDDDGEILVEDEEQVLKEGWELDDEGKPVKTEKPEKEGEEDDHEKKVADLEEALRKERGLRRKAEREAKKNGRKKPAEKSEKDTAEENAALQAATEKTKRLARGLLNKEIDSAILEAARAQGFIDPTDALTEAIRKEVDFDQDEDDPTDIDIDEDSVLDAVKSLAAKKKHLVGKGTPEERSGGKFSRKGKGGSSKDDSQEKLYEHYPSLR